MNISTKHIPLLITLGLSLASVFMTSFFSLSLVNGEFSINYPSLFGLIGLVVTCATIPLKREIWVYAFMIVIGASFTPYVEVSFLRFSLFLGSFELNFISLALLIAHMALNLGDKDASIPPPPVEGWTKVNWFKHQHQDKSDEEIQRLLNGDLVPEAKQALEEILESRKSNE